MKLLHRISRKLTHIRQHYINDRLAAECFAPIVANWYFAEQNRPVPNPSRVRSVLVWNVDSFGDFLFITPLLRALRNGYLQARIELVLNRACLPLAETNPHIDHLIPVDAAQFYSGTGLLTMPRELQGKKYDVVVIAEMGPRPADAARIIARRLQAGYIVSSNLGLLKKLPDKTLPANKSEYWPAYFMRLAECLGLPTLPPRLEVITTASEDAEALRIVGPDRETRAIGFHPMVANYALTTKKWPDESFLELGQALSKQAPTRLFLTGAADEAMACERMADQLRQCGVNASSVAGQLSLRGTVALFKHLSLLITGDTSALHLASAAGTPTVALFGATDERRIASPETIVIKEDLPCRPCHRYTDRRPQWPKCLYDRPWCLHRITSDTVAAISSSRLLSSRAT